MEQTNKSIIVLSNATVPAFRGDVDNGYCLDCSNCGYRLISNVIDKQVLGVIIRCPACESFNFSQDRIKGEAIPSKRVVINNGSYLISDCINLAEGDAAIVAENTVKEYGEEVGIKQPLQSGSNDLNDKFLQDIVDDGIKLLGQELYKRHLSTIKKSRASRTPKGSYHRLVELIEYAKHVSMDLKSATNNGNRVAINGDLISELMSVNSLFQRWKNHPAYSELRKSLANSTDVQHAIIQLTIASYLADVGNGVTLVFGKSLGKIPDIYVLATCTEKLDLEVKTPESLRNASNNLSKKDAEKVINNAIKSSRGQTSRKHPSILAIGGFHLTTDSVDNIERAAQAYLNKSGSKKTNLAAISVCNITYILNEIEDQQGKIVYREFSPSATFRIAINPNYSYGDKIKIVT